MNDIESSVRNFLPRMIKGKEVELTRAKREAISKWSLKTMMMFQCAHPREHQTLISKCDYQRFRTLGSPSASMQIWVATMDPPRLAGQIEHAVEFIAIPLQAKGPDGLSLETPAYTASLRIGHFAAQVIQVDGGPHGGRLIIKPNKVLAKFVLGTWPAAGQRTKNWPPPGKLNEMGNFDYFARVLATPGELHAKHGD
ncbi:MAG TPA: hypothetical protein VGE93_16505 [Bryobacteraceae bacterium]